LSLGERAKDGDKQLIASIGRAALPYSLLVHAYSDLHFRPSLLQSSFEPGATVRLRVSLDQYGIPLDTAATVWADVTRPDGTTAMVTLARSSAGRFGASFIAGDVGVYTARLRARGVTFEGQGFAREQRLTATVFIGGDKAPPAKPDDRLCQLVECLLRSGIVTPELEKELAARRIHLRALLECLEKHCRESEVPLGGERPYSPGAAAISPRALTLEEIRSAVLSAGQVAAATPAHFAELVKGQPVPQPKPDAAATEHHKFRENPFAKPPSEKKGHGR
jgi:hypothetical protein